MSYSQLENYAAIDRANDRSSGYQGYDSKGEPIPNVIAARQGIARGYGKFMEQMICELAYKDPSIGGSEFEELALDLIQRCADLGITVQKKTFSTRYYAVTLSPDPSCFGEGEELCYVEFQKFLRGVIFSKAMVLGAIWVYERQKSGNPHVHAIVKCRPGIAPCRVKAAFTSSFLSFKWGGYQAAQFIADVKPINDIGWDVYIKKTLDSEEDIAWRESLGFPEWDHLGDISYEEVQKELLPTRYRPPALTKPPSGGTAGRSAPAPAGELLPQKKSSKRKRGEKWAEDLLDPEEQKRKILSSVVDTTLSVAKPPPETLPPSGALCEAEKNCEDEELVVFVCDEE